MSAIHVVPAAWIASPPTTIGRSPTRATIRAASSGATNTAAPQG
jgi:hypothetical protein